MDLLSILIKERELEWPSNVAQCAEHFTTLGARRSSGFQLALVDLLVQELDARCSLYLEHRGNQVDFDEFFTTQKMGLHSWLKSRFSVSIPGDEWYNLLQEKYRAIMFSNRSPPPKPPIGFNIE